MLSKSYLYHFTRTAYRFLKNNPRHVRLDKIRNREKVRNKFFPIAGFYFPDTNRIIIDYRAPVIAVMIHEILHAMYPNWSERKVERMESALINQLSRCQMRRLLKILSSVI